jgi:hypothetical protein
LEFQSYNQALEPLVKNLNRRLREGGVDLIFPETHVPRFPKQGDTPPYQEMFLLVHDGQVRGGYLLTHEQFAIAGVTESVACGPQINLSEGIIDRQYGMVGVFLVQHALSKQPLMYALGIGGMNEPQSKLLIAMGWTLYPVPFYFRVVNPEQFLANIVYLRKRNRLQVPLDFLNSTGLGRLGLRMMQFRINRTANDICGHFVGSFGKWADEIWERCREKYSLLSVRDSRTLNVVYPISSSRFLRLKVSHGSEVVGWAVMLDTQMSGHRQFGHMRVGSIVDCLALPEHASFVVQAATRFLEDRGVNLIVSNQASAAWCKALSRAGFLRGPSNYIFGISPDLAKRLPYLKEAKPRVHMNRGNGDGPINL